MKENKDVLNDEQADAVSGGDGNPKVDPPSAPRPGPNGPFPEPFPFPPVDPSSYPTPIPDPDSVPWKDIEPEE